jgi:hypothetical protein
LASLGAPFASIIAGHATVYLVIPGNFARIPGNEISDNESIFSVLILAIDHSLGLRMRPHNLKQLQPAKKAGKRY